MKKIVIIFILVISVFSVYPDNETSIYGYSSTITEPFSTNIYGESVSQTMALMSSMPNNPGEPIPDPEPVTTPLGDIPMFMFWIMAGTYILYKETHRKK